MRLPPSAAYRLSEVQRWVRHTRRRLRRLQNERSTFATLVSVVAACILLFLLFPFGGDEPAAAVDGDTPPRPGRDILVDDAVTLPHVYAPRRPAVDEPQVPGAEEPEVRLPLHHGDAETEGVEPLPAVGEPSAVQLGGADPPPPPGATVINGPGAVVEDLPPPPNAAGVDELGAALPLPLDDLDVSLAEARSSQETLESRLRAGLPIGIDAGADGNVAGDAPPAPFVGAWEHIMHDVAVAVKTGREVAGARLGQQTTEGWLSLRRRIPNLLLLSDEVDPALGTVDIRAYARGLSRDGGEGDGASGGLAAYFARGGWKGDKDKNLPGFHLLVRRFPAARFYVMVDDDTYLLLDNFARWLQRKKNMPPETSPTVGGGGGPHAWMPGVPPPPPPRAADAEVPLFTGKAFLVSRCGEFGRGKVTSGVRHPTFFHGGSGIVLNAAAARALVAAAPGCIRRFHACWAGDMQVSMCLRSAGVAGTSYPITNAGGSPTGGRTFERGFFPYSLSVAFGDKRYKWRWQSHEEPLTFHKMPASQLRLMREYEASRLAAAGNGSTGAVVQYAPLREFLTARGVRPEANKPGRGR